MTTRYTISHQSTFAACLLFFAAHAFAEWVPKVKGANLTAYIDPSSLKKTGDNATLRVLVDYKKRPFDGNNLPYLSSLMRVEYDCAGDRFRSLAITSFEGPMATGHRPFSSNEPAEWKSVQPRTIQYELIDVACGPRAKKTIAPPSSPSPSSSKATQQR